MAACMQKAWRAGGIGLPQAGRNLARSAWQPQTPNLLLGASLFFCFLFFFQIVGNCRTPLLSQCFPLLNPEETVHGYIMRPTGASCPISQHTSEGHQLPSPFHPSYLQQSVCYLIWQLFCQVPGLFHKRLKLKQGTPTSIPPPPPFVFLSSTHAPTLEGKERRILRVYGI